MCGLTAIIGETNEAELRRLTNLLRHRGPDGEGYFLSDNCALGHRRLSIIDIEGGKQPLRIEDRNAAIAFNGEIYNYHELRGSFLGKQSLKSSSDTEILLRMYLSFGADCVKYLRGMFAFVIFDQGRIFAARDRLGIKPLYIGRSATATYFASELKALPSHCKAEKFPPGSIFTPEVGLRSYYSVPFPEQNDELDFDRACQLLDEVLRDSVRARMVADVPVGVFLSGGLDSTIIAAIMREYTNELLSFSVGVKGSPDLAAAELAAEYLETRHFAYEYSLSEMVEVLPEVIYHLESYDQPLVRSAVPNYFLARLAAAHVKVVLSGEGADEIFGGYHYLKKREDQRDFHGELHRITATLHNTNLQRADRMSMAHGLEARVPFLDPALVDFGFSLPTRLIHPASHPMEKYLLRATFESLLPPQIVWRKKEKFSAGAGSMHLLEEHAQQQISDFDLAQARAASNGTVRSKEEALYYKIFKSYFPGADREAVVGRTVL